MLFGMFCLCLFCFVCVLGVVFCLGSRVKAVVISLNLLVVLCLVVFLSCLCLCFRCCALSRV